MANADADSDGELSVKKQPSNQPPTTANPVAGAAVPAVPPVPVPPPSNSTGPAQVSTASQQFIPQIPQLQTSIPTSVGLPPQAISRVIMPQIQPVVNLHQIFIILCRAILLFLAANE